jgi:hypothetical protein
MIWFLHDIDLLSILARGNTVLRGIGLERILWPSQGDTDPTRLR